MEQKVNKCDNCGKITEDRYEEIGWIRIDNISNITIYGGRKESGMGDALRFINDKVNIDFCCFECMVEFLYLKNRYFNNGSKDLKEKLETIDSYEYERKNKIKKIYNTIHSVIVRKRDETV